LDTDLKVGREGTGQRSGRRALRAEKLAHAKVLGQEECPNSKEVCVAGAEEGGEAGRGTGQAGMEPIVQGPQASERPLELFSVCWGAMRPWEALEQDSQ
jgi:hypothetical protein